MSQSLKNVQMLAKAGKIISKVVFILCLIGAIACLVGIIVMSSVGSLVIDGKELSAIIKQESGYNITVLSFACTVGTIACLFECVVSKFAEVYFTHQLDAGTPFTYNGAKEIRRLGIICIAAPLCTLITAEIARAIFSIFTEIPKDIVANEPVALDLGIAFIVASFVFKYGAELMDKTQNNNC